jgi:hypothetical protein
MQFESVGSIFVLTSKLGRLILQLKTNLHAVTKTKNFFGMRAVGVLGGSTRLAQTGIRHAL